MAQVFSVIFPVFALIGLGFFMVKRNLFSQSGVDDLTRFIFYLAVPALLFRTAASGISHEELELGIILAYFGVGLSVLFLGYFLSRSVGRELSIVTSISSSFGNLALIGLPIVQTAYGTQGLVPIVTIISFNAMILFTVPCVMIETYRHSNVNIFGIFLGAIKSVVTNPLVIGLVSGWLLSSLDLHLPVFLDRITELLSKAASPCALFAVGGGMARYSLKLGETKVPVLIATCLKLVIMPICVLLICKYVVQLSPLWTLMATLAAAMPTGANSFIFATRYKIGDRIAGNTILITTAVSFFTLSAFLLLFPAP